MIRSSAFAAGLALASLPAIAQAQAYQCSLPDRVTVPEVRSEAPRQLPVGALTAAIGVPLFLILMSRVRAERYR